MVEITTSEISIPRIRYEDLVAKEERLRILSDFVRNDEHYKQLLTILERKGNHEV